MFTYFSNSLGQGYSTIFCEKEKKKFYESGLDHTPGLKCGSMNLMYVHFKAKLD